MKIVDKFEGKADLLVDKTLDFAVASVTEDGYPRVCVLRKIKSEGVNEIYFSTGTNSKKVMHFENNEKASVCCYNENDVVTLIGKMTIYKDKKTKEKMWQGWMKDHFSGGMTDPNYCVIKFVPVEMTSWVNGVFLTEKYKQA